MFVTLIRENDQLAASVRLGASKVEITTDHKGVRELLWEIYHPDMSILEFTKANYRLNRLRPQGITWEVVLEEEMVSKEQFSTI